MTFKKIPCQICNELISQGGAAYTSHMRMHVRSKEAVEHKRNGKLIFIKAGINIADIEPYAKLGYDPLPGQPSDVWELPNLPTELPAIDPSSYFITSGEAVKKAEKLVQDCYHLTSLVRVFRDRLRTARGSKKYLETVRDGQKLLVKCKEKRKKHTDDDITDEKS